MASSNSNRHWPSMFKSKPCNSHHHHQWQHDNIHSSLISPSGCHRTPYTSGVDEERSAEPKPRWNPKPEQIRILEAIFNSGMVNPPRDEIRKIRAQLQEYGQVGDANVFYWFQNRKSRSKHKLRHLHSSSNAHQTPNRSNSSPKEIVIPSKKGLVPNIAFSNNVSSDIVVTISSTPSPPPPPPPPQPQPFFLPVQQSGGAGGVVSAIPVPITQGFCFTQLSSVVQVQPEGPRDHHQHINLGSCTSLLLNEIMSHAPRENVDQEKVMQMQQHPPTTQTTVVLPTSTTTVTVPSPISQIQGVVEEGMMEGPPGGTVKSTVFINDVAFEVGVGPLNVGEAFGDDVVLIHSSGQPVLTDEWGVTLQPLQHGAFYYLI